MKKVGYLACGFDLLNVGHLDVVAQARAQCDELVVGVVTDEQIQEWTGRGPVVPLSERVVLVRHLRGVSRVVVHDVEQLWSLGAAELFVAEDAGGIEGAVRLVAKRNTKSDILRGALRTTWTTGGPETVSAVA